MTLKLFMKRLLLIFGFTFSLASCGGGPQAKLIPPNTPLWHMHSPGEWWVTEDCSPTGSPTSTFCLPTDKVTPDLTKEIRLQCSPESVLGTKSDCDIDHFGKAPNVGDPVEITKIWDHMEWCLESQHVSTAPYNPATGCPTVSQDGFLLPGTNEYYDLVKCDWSTTWDSIAISIDIMPTEASCLFLRYADGVNNPDGWLYAGGEADILGQDINWYRNYYTHNPEGYLYWSDDNDPGDQVAWRWMDDNNGIGGILEYEFIYQIQETVEPDPVTGLSPSDPYSLIDTWKMIPTSINGVDVDHSVATNCNYVQSVSKTLGPLPSLSQWGYLGQWAEPAYVCPETWSLQQGGWWVEDQDTSTWP